MARSFGTHAYARMPFNSQGPFVPHSGSDRIRIFLVSIQRPIASLSSEGRAFEPMRVMRVEPGDPIEMSLSDAVMGPLPRLKPAAQPEVPDESPLLPRAVRGEILRDEQGCLYEKIGQNVRRLHHVVSGPRGEVIDLVPALRPESAGAYRVDHRDSSGSARPAIEPTDSGQAAVPAHAAESDGPAKSGAASASPCRKLFPEPGQWCVVSFGDFRGLLNSQLAHPERLRESHRIACFVQVFEATAVERLDRVMDWLKSSSLDAGVRPLNEAAARLLGLSRLLLNRRPMQSATREPGVVLPGDRLFRLQVAGDPTADPISRPNTKQQPQEKPGAPGDAEADSKLNAPLKTAVPEQFCKPWEFQLSRDEALCDIRLAASVASPLRSLTRGIASLVRGKGSDRRWRAMLLGRNPDEQLWAVRPPSHSLSSGVLRDWARRTLEAGGYDPAVMFLEWEIFWRRKGLN